MRRHRILLKSVKASDIDMDHIDTVSEEMWKSKVELVQKNRWKLTNAKNRSSSYLKMEHSPRRGGALH